MCHYLVIVYDGRGVDAVKQMGRHILELRLVKEAQQNGSDDRTPADLAATAKRLCQDFIRINLKGEEYKEAMSLLSKAGTGGHKASSFCLKLADHIETLRYWHIPTDLFLYRKYPC